MNVIETMKRILTDCDLMDEFNGIHVDYTESQAGTAGLYSNGASKIGEDIIGNPIYQINFQLYAGLHAAIDFDRLQNSDFLLNLTYYLNSLKGVPITETVNGQEYTGEITKVTCSNALLYSVPTGDLNDGVTYQIQISVTYGIELE